MVVIFIFELVILFFFSRVLTSQLGLLFHKIFRSQKVSILLIALIFLPGTIIHEFSHAIMAKLLFVHVGKMELLPELNGDNLKLGSVEIGQTDIIRNFAVGIAPFMVGTSLLLVILFQAFSHNIIGFNLLTTVVLFFVFVIANTMYSSKKDMEGAIEFFLLIVAPIIILYYLGVRIPGLNWDLLRVKGVENFFQTEVIFLGVPLVLDVAIIAFAKIINKR